MLYYRNWIVVFLSIVCLWLVISCTKAQPTEGALRIRVQGYWDAMIDGNRRLAHEFLDPRNKGSVEKFIDGLSRMNFRNCTIEEVLVDGVEAIVKVKYMIKVVGLPFDIPEVERSERERWVFLDGIWYYKGLS